ncbi:AraC family transcriptional regulator [Pseudomonas sp. PDM13]|uniref:AraC family transcriptional regulator n=1 Tax=Pseudomonas sp. PDM13 TaxID=2769255 RepID=UPI0021DF9DD0|nr:AraC family transcriptional regulator [Pseudomonas sp. PDM13]MCU9949505.1 AraC family transcriptional regulator [Pseudomonas sp. PDM13]
MDTQDAWSLPDPLGEALHSLRMSGTFYCSSEFSAPWGLELPAMPQCLMFHVLTSGRCWLQLDGETPLAMAPGDLVLVPHGRGHRLVDEPGSTAQGLFDLPREPVSERYEILRHGGGGERAEMVCGALRFDHPLARQLLEALPRVLVLGADEGANGDWLQGTLRFMRDEARTLRPGGESVITRLADILVIQAIRAWLERDPAARTGWLGALQDRQVGRALALIHRDPARNWTLESLAGEVAMSRSAFAARFSEQVGEPAMHYLARWRMSLALSWLQDGEMGVGQLAERLGYQSDAAFSRAFKRFNGMAPGVARRRLTTSGMA